MFRWGWGSLLVGIVVAAVLAARVGVSALGALDPVSDPAPGVSARTPGPPPVILEARISSWESGAAPGAPPVLAIEVDRVLDGFVPGSSLVIHVTPGEHPFLEPHLRSGERFQLELERRTDGDYDLRGGHLLRAGYEDQPAPLPGGIVKAPDPIDQRSLPSEDDELSSAQAAASSTPTFEESVVELVNEERLANGNLPPLKHNALLDDSSETHSSNMASRDFFAHCDPDTGTLPWDRMEDAGYLWSSAAENIAAGYSTPTEVMAGWMDSPGHRANILATGSREIGVGYVLQTGDTANVRFDQNGDCTADSFGNGPYFRYWTQNFGSRFGVFPVVIEREAHSTENQTVELYLYGAGWAQEMRFSNDHSTWSSWQPFSSTAQWNLSSGNGSKTVWAQLRNGGTVREASDTIEFAGACTVAQDQIELTNQTVSGAETFEACVEVMAHSGVHVSGDATFRAGQRVVLGDGFSVASGATFRAVIQTP